MNDRIQLQILKNLHVLIGLMAVQLESKDVPGPIEQFMKENSEFIKQAEAKLI